MPQRARRDKKCSEACIPAGDAKQNVSRNDEGQTNKVYLLARIFFL